MKLAWIALIALLASAPVYAETKADTWAPDLAMGEAIPGIEAPDTAGDITTASEVMGPNGMIFFFVRSTSW